MTRLGSWLQSWTVRGLLASLLAILVIAPSVADFGYTYDEPAYRYSQELSRQWWKLLSSGRFQDALDSDTLLYYWPYGRFGVNFHPPLAGQLNLAAHTLFGSFLADIPARRMASVLEFSVLLGAFFGFMGRRYGMWTAGVCAGSLLLMPRLFGQAHLIDTDTPGLLLWGLTTFCFWNGLYEQNARASRVAVGVLIGLAFVEKMGAVLVVLPVLAWLSVRLLRTRREIWRARLLLTFAMVLPLLAALFEIRRLAEEFLKLQRNRGLPITAVSPAKTNLFVDHPATWMHGGFLLLPLVVWLIWHFTRKRDRQPTPGLDIWLSILAWGPAIAWLGNPAWWREAIPRLAHYYAITTTRQGVLPDIQILYFGQIYEYSLPWENAWVLIWLTVPASLFIATILGLWFAPWRDRLPVFFLLNMCILPAMRMLQTPAHDGVRLFLPTFLFIAAFCGWGTIGLANFTRRDWMKPLLTGVVLLPAAWALYRIHPYELSYYSEWVGGSYGAWKRGFELSYWYDAFTNDFVRQMNEALPREATLAYANKQSEPLMVPQDQQALGLLRGDIRLEDPSIVMDGRSPFPHVMLLTHDSKSDAVSKFLFVLEPLVESRPAQLDRAVVAQLFDPRAASIAWALQLLLDKPSAPTRETLQAPRFIQQTLPVLGRFWGDGLKMARPLGVELTILDWAKRDPESLRAEARLLAETGKHDTSADTERLWNVMNRYASRAVALLRARPEALPEAIELIIQKPDALRSVLLRQGFTDPEWIGGRLNALPERR